MNKCKFCDKELQTPLYSGYCQQCYNYFIVKGYKLFSTPGFGNIKYVEDKNSKQYGHVVCHICGKAFTKLQQHVYYAHHLTKSEYCERFGIDKKCRLTSGEYNEKMRTYSYKYNMDEQVKRVGHNTRFQKGVKNNYIRSYMTRKRLQDGGKHLAEKYGPKKNKDKEEI